MATKYSKTQIYIAIIFITIFTLALLYFTLVINVTDYSATIKHPLKRKNALTEAEIDAITKRLGDFNNYFKTNKNLKTK